MLNVIWLTIKEEHPPRGYWDHGLIDYIFDKFEVRHHLRYMPEDVKGGVVVIPARNQAPDIAEINAEINKLEWCVVILTGDEESVFPYEELKHPRMRVWVMSPQIGRHDSAANLIGSGFRYEQPALQRQFGMQERKYDWFFSGQITHEIRQRMAEQLRTMKGGKLVESEGFGQGLRHPDYIKAMLQAKFVTCPSGPVSPDNFRLYEALEAGCVPIADGGGYWPHLLRENPPFPIVSDWSVLSNLMPELLRDWPHNSNITYAWWQTYKRRMADQLEDDVTIISGEKPKRVVESDITVLMPTSAIPSHPSTQMIERTIASVRERLPNSEIIVMIDGLSPEMMEHKTAYDLYTQRLLWKLNNEYENIIPIVMQKFSHQTGMTKEALKLVRTPLILFVEHDTPLVHDIPFDQLSDLVRSGYANTIRLHHEDRILEDHKYLMLDQESQSVHGIPLIRTTQWSQRPHLTSTAYYRQICDQYFNEDKPMFIEHVMYGIVVHQDWNESRLHIYAPPENMLRSTNLNGRAYEVQE